MKNNFQLLVIILSFTLISSVSYSAKISSFSIKQMTKVASEVLNDLKRAKGILPTEPPFLKVKEFSGSIKLAIFHKDLNEIHLDSLSYEIMREMGRDSSDALAFLLGHELGHYINKHKRINHAIVPGTSDFMATRGVRQLSDDVNTNSNNFDSRINAAFIDFNDTHDEAEADFEGGFLGYLAGYKPMAAGKEFLKRAYDHPFMTLTNTTPGYPSLNDRLEILELTTLELEKLIPYFEMANYLAALQQYGDAIPYLERVLEKFQSREIYSNIGVIYIYEILRLFDKPICKYKLPLTLDASFRLPHPNSNTKHTGGTRNSYSPFIAYPICHLNKMQEQITIAESYFQKAIDLDPKYTNAYLNLSIAQTIKALLYDHNRVIDQTHPDCTQAKQEQLIKAEATAYQAKIIAEEALESYAVFLYSKEDTIHNALYLAPIPEGRMAFPQQEEEKFRQSLSLGFSNEEYQKKYKIYLNNLGQEPYRSIYFNSQVYVRAKSGEPPLLADTVIWLHNTGFPFQTRNEVPIPDLGVTLSNIQMQIDIILLLQNKLSDDFTFLKHGIEYLPYSSHDQKLDGMVETTPFADALEINYSNKLARYNRSVAYGKTPELKGDGSSYFYCSYLDEHNESEIFNIYNKVENWVYDDSLRGSKLLTDDLAWKNFQRASQQKIKYSQVHNYKLFVNETKVNHHNREEKCYILEPTNFDDAINICKIKIGSSIEEIIELHGESYKTIHLTNGSFLVFEFTAQTGNLAVGSDNYSTRDTGIIIKLDSANRVKSWAQFQRSIKIVNDGKPGYNSFGFD